MIVFANRSTPRLLYILDFVGNQLLGRPLSLTTNSDQFRSFNGPRINYSETRLSDAEFWIRPAPILFEYGLRPQHIQFLRSGDQPYIFPTDGDLHFDPFAACFYLISRFEEYLAHEKDRFGRYAHQNSLAWKEGFLDVPQAEIWLHLLKLALTSRFPSVEWVSRDFEFLPTYDIDEAFCYRHKSWFRTLGGTVLSLLRGNFSAISERSRVLRGRSRDPYDSYDWLHSLHDRYGLRPIYFFHVGLRRGRYDRNIAPWKRAMEDLIGKHADRYEIGIHPSWRSHRSDRLLKYELLKLTHQSGRPVSNSRQHYIRFTLPDTYRLLIAHGIHREFSMGYGSINGFRASVSTPFFWYDLGKEQATTLLVYPYCFMDANSLFEQKQDAAQTFRELCDYCETVRLVGGTLITIWHNNILGDARRFPGWREMYEEFVSTKIAGA
ncbi:MAG TPA: polysaccharide deacetylase family protein [Chitinophagaceae bacterium]|nr:polysaccharide deacetylase family protein [Chitinophagaceae bacterium]